jgi:hypothetical protein
MTDNIAERVMDRWRGENLSLKSLLSPDEISRYFEFLGVTPSSELLMLTPYSADSTKMKMDDECLSFWSLEKVTEENRRDADDKIADSFESFFRLYLEDSKKLFLR